MALPPPARRSDAWYHSRLAPPVAGRRPSVVIDTDAANEIDDQFALAWALLSAERIDLRAVYAAPYSFEHRRVEMIRAQQARLAPERANAADLELLRQHRPRLEHADRQRWNLHTLALPVFDPPAVGMQRSHDEILRVFERLQVDPQQRVFRGSAGYLPSASQPLRSDAVDHLIASARAMPGDEPLYVLALACVTNVVSALLLAPDLIDRLVVVWTSGYPSHAPQTNFSLNLEQDLFASQYLFDCGVPLVYLPGFHVGAQLRLSLPEIERSVLGRGAIGDYLHALYTHNPLWEFVGIDSFHAHSWVMWDLINVAWLLNPDWVPSDIVATPVLGADRRWRATAGRPPMREAFAVARDSIFADFFDALERAPA